MVNYKSNNKIKNGLYLVPTPIGNMGDITFRAIEILKKSDLVLCEDTRISKNFLNKFMIKTSLISNHKFNEKKNVSKTIDFLKGGKLVSLITDAGTPGISDPGAILVRKCVEEDINVFPLPGPSAVTAAMSVSGFIDKYFFYGFFPEKDKIIKKDLEILSDLNCSIVFFISPKKLNKNIPKIKEFFFDRNILVCREISKLYEEYVRSPVKNLELFNDDLKGELTIVISEKIDKKKTSHSLSESDKRTISKIINKLSVKEIVGILSKNTKVPKKEIYNYCLKLKK